MSNNPLSVLPQVELLLQDPKVSSWFVYLSRPLVSKLASDAVESARERLLARSGAADTEDIIYQKIVATIENRCETVSQNRLRDVINATGIAVHTNLGRSPLSKEVWRDAEAANTAYSNLELSLNTGKRDRRGGILGELLSLLTGCEDSFVVNNCAAAVFLMLTSLASGKEVVISRGEQVQIGGGFRIPEILRLSQAVLKEVGTTNITLANDYAAAVSENTAMVLVVHKSNFTLSGFTSKPKIPQIRQALPARIILAVDQGSGITSEQLGDEASVENCLRSGADIVSFSGDKVLGGPQAGIIAGDKELLKKIASHPLARTFRTGKTIRSLLEKHLVRKLNGEKPGVVEQLTSVGSEKIRKSAEFVFEGLDEARLSVSPSQWLVGGGSAPGKEYPSFSIEMSPKKSTGDLLFALRSWHTPIIGTITDNRVHLNMATVREHELPLLKDALQQIMQSH